MARVLLAWELGGGFGHLVHLREMARSLRASGHACAFALRNLGAAERVLEPELGPRYQAPMRASKSANAVQTQASYASLLHNIGFENPLELAARIRSWRDLMRILRTEVLIADHSPLALIAAHSLGIKALAIGNGFTLPPVQQPFPSFRPQMQIADSVLRANDEAVLTELNQAMKILGLPAYRSLQGIFEQSERALITYAEVDHYESGRQENYLGHPDLALGRSPSWEDGQGPKLFVHLRPSADAEVLLQALKQFRARILIKCDGLPAQQLSPFLRPGMQVTDENLNFREVAEQCDAMVAIGSHGLSCEQLLAGRPALLLPGVHEQYLVTRRVRQLGAGISAEDLPGGNIQAGLDQLIEDESLAEAACRFAKKHAGSNRQQIVPSILASLGL